MDLKHPSEVLEREFLFVPSGYDSINLIQELIKGSQFISPSGEPYLFDQVIVKPDVSKTTAGKTLSR
jgi:hypothetical protein